MPGKTIKILVTDESPRALKRISTLNWSGYAYYGTRNQIKNLKQRSDAFGQGIYFLVSEKDKDSVRIYIGETENFCKRITQHEKNKDWWTRFIVFQSKDNILNKVHVKYLEYKFLTMAKDVFEISLENEMQNIPETKLSEEDSADMQIFQDNILYILESLDIGFFKKRGPVSSTEEGDEYYITTKEKEYLAFMTKIDDMFILKKESFLKREAQNSFKKYLPGYYEKWKDLVESEQVKPINESYVKLLKDIEFSSPTICASIAKGRSANGNTDWKNKKTHKTLKEDID